MAECGTWFKNYLLEEFSALVSDTAALECLVLSRKEILVLAAGNTNGFSQDGYVLHHKLLRTYSGS